MSERSAYSATPSAATLSTPPASWFPAPTPPRHLKITGAAPAFGFERCEDQVCDVEADGTASSCGRLACPSCGCGGTNLATMALLDAGGGLQVRCTCGYVWVREGQRSPLLAAIVVSG
jgi:hypothetical protein